MFIKLCKSQNFKHRFEIFVDQDLKYYAGYPWMNLSLHSLLRERCLRVMTDTDDQIELISAFGETEESIRKKDRSNMWKFLTYKTQTGYVTSVLDDKKNPVASFYSKIRVIAIGNRTFHVEYDGETILGYDKSAGKSRHMSLYMNGTQIGQIVKPLNFQSNHVMYYLFLLDEYSRFARILSLFAVYFDNRYYNKHEEILQEQGVNISYSIDKNDKYYNESWIRDNFDLAGVAPEFIPLDEKNQKFNNNQYKIFYLILLGFFLVILLFMFLFVYVDVLGIGDSPVVLFSFLGMLGILVYSFISLVRLRRK